MRKLQGKGWAHSTERSTSPGNHAGTSGPASGRVSETAGNAPGKNTSGSGKRTADAASARASCHRGTGRVNCRTGVYPVRGPRFVASFYAVFVSSEERRVWKEYVRTCSYRWSPSH